MKNILFITTSPRVNGNGDILTENTIRAAESTGAGITRIDIRNMNINGCKACNACMKTGLCVQKDDFSEVLSAMQESDSIVITVPIYMNLPCAQSITLLNRLFNLFSPAYKGSGKNKKLAIMLTFGGSNPETMKTITENAISFFAPSEEGMLGNSYLSEYLIETFPQVENTLQEDPSAYFKKAAEIGKWAAE